MKPQFSVDLSKNFTHWPLKLLTLRIVWEIFGSPVIKYFPRPLNRINRFILIMFGAKLGKKCLISPGARILMPWNLVAGDYVAIGRDCEIYNYDLVEIGDMTVISQYSFLCTGTHDYTDKTMPLKWKPIKIGSHCWIAAGAFLAPGVSVGDGVVVGAKSVVTENIPAWHVAAGNPCKVVKRREIRR